MSGKKITTTPFQNLWQAKTKKPLDFPLTLSSRASLELINMLGNGGRCLGSRAVVGTNVIGRGGRIASVFNRLSSSDGSIRATRQLRKSPPQTCSACCQDHFLSAIHHREFRRNLSQKSKQPKTRDNSQNARHHGNEITLERCQASMSSILSHLSKYKAEQHSDHDNLRSLLQNTEDLIGMLESGVENGLIRPSGKHGKALSMIFERVLYLYNQISILSNGNIRTFQNCQGALEVLSRWNLDFLSRHYEAAISVANREERWQDASDLFWKQIDPEAGFNPVKVSVANPEGLYAIARRAQEEEAAVADLVFDAVMQLSMVSPQDQAVYVLAAGTALGKAGEWGSATEYLKTSFMGNRYGRPLVLSVMHACLLSGRADVAYQVYEDQIAHSSSTDPKRMAEEWQWGGQRDTLDPLTRDLTMRAIFARDDMSERALALFRETIEEGVMISGEALLGVVEACENDGNVDGSFIVLQHLLSTAERSNWIVPGKELLWIADSEVEKASNTNGTRTQSLSVISDIAASILRTCNSTSSFGMGMLSLRKVELLLMKNEEGLLTKEEASSWNETLGSIVPILEYNDNLLAATMACLCGLRCHGDAIKLYNHVSASLEGKELRDAKSVMDFARRHNTKYEQSNVGNPWVNARKHIQRFTATLDLLQRTGHSLSNTEEDQLLKGLAIAMHSCTAAHHPDVSLQLLLELQKQLSGDGIEFEKGLSSLIFRNDSLTAEIIDAYRWKKDWTTSIEIFHSILYERSSELTKWPLTCSAGLSSMVAAGRGKEALNIFGAIDDRALIADCYSTIGRYLSHEGRAKELGDLYQSALKQGNLSEELSIITMKTVATSKVDNRLRVLRAIVNDCARNAGVDREFFLRTRYWRIKRALGFYYARLLMWWNDPETCHLDELELALHEFYERKSSGLKVRNDAIRVIVENAISFQPGGATSETTRWKHIPLTQEHWSELLQEVLHEARSASISYDPSFVHDVVAAFRNLGMNAACTFFISETLRREVRLDKDTLIEALEAAKLENSLELMSDIECLISG